MPSDPPGRTGRRDTGTYLFVREGKKKRGEPSTARPPASTVSSGPSLAQDSILAPLEPGAYGRLRYRRRRLSPADLNPRLVFFLAPDSPATADLRGLASQVLEGLEGSARILVSSPRAGAGRTLTCLNLASAVAEQARCTVVDVHLARPAVAAAMGCADAPGWRQVVAARRGDQRAPLELLLVADRLALLPLGAEAQGGADLGGLATLLDEVSAAADLILLDGPPVLEGEGIAPLAGLYETILLIVSPADMARGDYEAALKRLDGLPVLGAVVVAPG